MEPLRPGLVTVVIPSYNSGPYLRQTLESVTRQDYPRIEIVVVDGGSTDGTLELLREWGDCNPGSFRWLSEPDRGQSDALNKGFRMARGEFIAWQNADDYYLPGAFEDPVSYLQSHPDVALTFGDWYMLDGETGAMRAHYSGGMPGYIRLMHGNYIPSQTTLVRREVLIDCGGVAEDLRRAMDYDLWLRIGLFHQIAYVPGFRAVFRKLPTSMSNADVRLTAREATLALERILGRPDIPDAIRSAGPAALQSHYLSEMQAALVFNAIPQAVTLLRLALDADLAFPTWPGIRSELAVPWLVEVGLTETTKRLVRLRETLAQEASRVRPQLRELTALVYLARGLDAEPRPGRRALPYIALALVTDRWWLRSKLPVTLVLRMVFGGQFDSTLRFLARASNESRSVVSRVARGLKCAS